MSTAKQPVTSRHVTGDSHPTSARLAVKSVWFSRSVNRVDVARDVSFDGSRSLGLRVVEREAMVQQNGEHNGGELLACNRLAAYIKSRDGVPFAATTRPTQVKRASLERFRLHCFAINNECLKSDATTRTSALQFHTPTLFAT